MKKKIYVVIALIIILGTVLTLTVGFRVSLDYSNHIMVEAKLGKEYKISDIKAITKEVLPKRAVQIQKASEYEDTIYIRTTGITDEQKNTLCQKINEKYGTDIKVEDLVVEQVASARLRDLAAPYIIPVVSATVIIIAYMAIKFRKLGVLNVILQTGIFTIVAEWLYMAILVITRYPIDKIVIPAGLVIYLAVILALNYFYEKNCLEEIEEEKKEEKKEKAKTKAKTKTKSKEAKIEKSRKTEKNK